MHDGNLMVHGKNEEYTAKPASHAALVCFIIRISLESPRAALIKPSSSTIEARAALAAAPLFLTLGLGLVYAGVGGCRQALDQLKCGMCDPGSPLASHSRPLRHHATIIYSSYHAILYSCGSNSPKPNEGYRGPRERRLSLELVGAARQPT